MNIALIGARGSGKTTIAKALAEKLGRKMFDMDDLISYEASGSPISEIIEKHDWSFFQELEYQVVQKLSGFKNIIISCGGGVVTDLDQSGKPKYSARKVAALKKNSIVIWLVVSPEIACQRIGEDKNRPSLTGGKTALEEMGEIIALRTPWYKQASDYELDSSIMKPQEIISAIEKILKEAS